MAARARRPSRRTWKPSAWWRRLHALREADDVSLGIGEERDLDGATLRGLHERPRAQLLGLRERSLEVVRLDVDGDEAAAVAGLADAAADAVLVRVGVDHRVTHRIVRVHVPVEELSVKVLELLRLLGVDLEVRDRSAHGISPPITGYCVRASV